MLMKKSFGLSVVITLLLALDVLAQEPDGRSGPGAMLASAAAAKGPGALAKVASHAGLSGGVLEEGHPWKWDRKIDLKQNAADRDSIEAAVSGFARSHPDHDVRLTDNFLSALRPGTHCMQGLQERITFRSHGPLMTLFSDLMHAINPTNPGGPAGYAGSGLGGAADLDPVVQRVSRTVTLDVTNATVVEAFSELARQVPGTVWIMGDEAPTPGTPHYCRLHLYTDGVLVTTGWVLKWEK